MSDPVVLLSTGDVVGPAGGVTDNSMVLFSGTSGKLIKGNNAVVTAQGLALLDDVDATANRATIGLNNVNNTSDVNKPVSTPQQNALDTKLNLTGGVLTGQLNGTRVGMTGTGNDYNSGAYEVAGNGAANTVFPTIGFHQPAAYAASLQLRGATDFRFYAQGATAYANVTANQFNGNLNGNAATVTNGYYMNGVNTGWFRNTGTTGWYNETYGGGIYMTDSSYVRTYNGKGFICANDIVIEGVSPTLRLYDTDNVINRYVHANGGTVGFLKSDGNWGLHNDNAGNTYSAGSITSGGAVNAPNLFGQGQTWQDVTGSRASGVAYTNSTGRPIQVTVNVNDSGGGAWNFVLNGTTLSWNDMGGSTDFASFVIPDGNTYQVNRGQHTIAKWMELR